MKKPFIVMVAAVAILLALALIINYVLLWRLFIASLLMILVAAVWTLFGSRGLRGSASLLPDHCQLGDDLEQDISISNRGPLPKMVEIAAAGDLPSRDGFTVIALDPGKDQMWRIRLSCDHRGRFHAGSSRLTVRDPFGLFAINRAVGQSQHVIVYPAIKPLPNFSPRLWSDTGYHTNRWLDTGASQDASRIREYTSGDSLNRIDWRATAHVGSLMVKVFDPYRSNRTVRSVWVALDLQAACQAGSGMESTEEYGCTIAASIIDKFHGLGLGVGLLLSMDKPRIFPPDRSEAHLRILMEALSLAKADGHSIFDTNLTQQSRYLSTDSILVAITPSVSTGLEIALRQVAARGLTTTAVLLDGASFGGPVSSFSLARRLTAGGVRAYTIHRGDDLSDVLNSHDAMAN
jgi:uncharacterized protein (DUF58 family)